MSTKPFQIKVKFLILKFGNLLIKNDKQQKVLTLIEGDMQTSDNLFEVIYSIILKQTGWEAKNVRLFQINVSSIIEVVFIIDAIKQTLHEKEKISGLRWFQLNNLPKLEELAPKDSDIINAFAALVHPGKTLDLEHLPPVFNPSKRTNEIFPQLLQLISPS